MNRMLISEWGMATPARSSGRMDDPLSDRISMTWRGKSCASRARQQTDKPAGRRWFAQA